MVFAHACVAPVLGIVLLFAPRKEHFIVKLLGVVVVVGGGDGGSVSDMTAWATRASCSQCGYKLW